MIGRRLGPYEVTARLGEGGMGEVWRATDSRLRREVAIKVLPPGLAGDRERLARFEREAQTLAALNHPNIAAIYGLEEANATQALVMELVEGEDLATRIARGPLPIEEALPIARQIAEALEAAHEQGIVHRDLKPTNVKVRADGAVKVLDFGLAKAMEPATPPAPAGALAHSPTLTAAHGTALGVILGTAAYMAPEQARGSLVDKRADVWAFGVVLHEMLTGNRLFAGDTVTDTLAAVLRAEIPWHELPAGAPHALRTVLRRCLERNAKNRLHDIADARLVLVELIAGEGAERSDAPVAARRHGRAAWLPWAAAAGGLVAGAAGWLATPGAQRAGDLVSYELAIPPPPGAQLAIGSNLGWGAISPDGRQVLFPASDGGSVRLWIRSLDRGEARPLPGTDGAFYPFWSPDSRWVGFFVPGALFKIEVAGGVPERICAAAWGRGGSWSPSGWIVFAPMGGGAISRVRAEGGEPIVVTALDQARGEDAHYWPAWLPDGTSFLYFVRSGRRENQGVHLGRVLDGGVDRERRRLVATAASGLFAPASAGREAMLLWAREDRLLARAFDPASATLSGAVFEVAHGVRVNEAQRATMASVSTTGSLVYASSAVGRFEVHAFDRRGAPVGALSIPPGDLHSLTVSPDGGRLAFIRVKDGQGDIWSHDLTTGSTRALTTTPRYEETPTWSPDGTELLFSAAAPGGFQLLRARADGETAPRPQPLAGSAVSPSRIDLVEWPANDWVLVTKPGMQGLALTAARLAGAGGTTPAAGVELASGAADYSLDLGALAFVSGETGTPQGFVVSVDANAEEFRLGGDRQRLAVEGARSLRWGQDGRELYAVAADGAVWAVPAGRRDGALRLGTPVRLFAGRFVDEDFDVYDDGQRFLFRVDPAAERQTLTVVLDWPARLAEAPR